MVNLPSPLPILTTTRLRLRPFKESDLENYFALYSDPQVTAGHGTDPWTEQEAAAKGMARYAAALANNLACRWVITRSGQDRLIGSVGFHELSHEHFRGEIGYDLMAVHWGQGLATEAVRAVVACGFNQIGFHRIEAIIDPANSGSERVLKKVGFRFEGDLRERFYDRGRFTADRYYGLLKREFESREE